MTIALIFDIKLTIVGNIGILLMINSILIIVFQFITLRRERNYFFMDILMSAALFYGQNLTYALASAYAVLGKKMEFSVTPKKLRNSAIRFHLQSSSLRSVTSNDFIFNICII